MLKRFRLLALALFLVFSILESLKYQREDVKAFYQDVLGQEPTWDFVTILKQFNACVLVLPLYHDIVAQAVTITQAFFVEWDVNLAPANIKFNNLRAMAKLPWIQHVVTSPTALEGEQTYRVNYFRISDKSFHNQGAEGAEEKLVEKPSQEAKPILQDDSDDSEQIHNCDIDYLPHNQQYDDQLFIN